MKPDFRQAVAFSHQLLEEHLDSGSTVVDATAGNGHDTVFLAELVGASGRVYAFDIQRQAIENTSKRLQRYGLQDRVTLIHDGHQHLTRYLTGPIDAVLFNLGYLPGGDKSIITKPETTLQAVEAGLTLLKEGGLVVLVIYPGHLGGEQELAALLKYAEQLDGHTYNVLHYHFINQPSAPPQVLAIKKRITQRR